MSKKKGKQLSRRLEKDSSISPKTEHIEPIKT